MAYETGIAAGHTDVLSKLKTFLTTNPELVAQGQQWAVERDGFGIGPLPWPNSTISYTTGTPNLYSPQVLPLAIPRENIALVISGKLNLANAGTYSFAIDTIGTADLLIDGVLVVGDYIALAALTNTWGNNGTISLAAGEHTFEYRISMASLPSATTFGSRLGIKSGGATDYTLMPTSMLTNPVYSYETEYSGVDSAKGDHDAVFASRSLFLKGSGLAGSDNIFVNLISYGNATNDIYNIVGYSATAYDEDLLINQQPGISGPKTLYMWNQPMQYWFIANGRRFIIVCRVSAGVYATFYGGFMLPYGLPSEFPYPIVIGGCGASSTAERWSVQTDEHRAFFAPGNPSSLELRSPENAQLKFCNTRASLDYTHGSTIPYLNNPGMRTSPDGEYALDAVTLVTVKGRMSQTVGNVYGELDGVYHISGFGNSAENIVTIDSIDYLVVQSVYRNGYNDFAAIALH